MEMGLLPGTEVTLERVAPLGDPLVVRVRGYALSLRKEEAHLVEIDRSTAP
jgi:Fe2+ transport system protein FeoA